MHSHYWIIAALSLVCIDAYCSNCYSCGTSSCATCNTGYYGSKYNSDCSLCGTCTAGYYQTTVCNTASNVKCSACTTTLPAGGYYLTPTARNYIEDPSNCPW